MPKYGSANQSGQGPSREEIRNRQNNAVWSGGGYVAPGGYDPGNDPNWVKPNPGRTRQNEQAYFEQELSNKYPDIPLYFAKQIEQYGWKPGGSYSYTVRIKDENDPRGYHEETKRFNMPAGSTVEQYSNPNYKPSANHQVINDPYQIAGRNPNISTEHSVSPYGQTRNQQQQGGSNVANQFNVNNGYYNPSTSRGGFNPNTFNSSLAAQGATPGMISNLNNRAMSAGQFASNQSGGPQDPNLGNQQGSIWNSPEFEAYKKKVGAGGSWNSGGPWAGNQATDPYQLPQNKPTLSNQGPYQMPGGPGPISMDPRSGGMGPNAGPRPRPMGPNMIGPNQQFAPGQQQYMGPAIVPMQQQNPGLFGQQNPNRFVGPYGQQLNRGTVSNQPGQRQFLQTTW